MKKNRYWNLTFRPSRPDLILMHPPSIYRFREQPVFSGPVSDVIPSSSLFEIYPIGFLTISEYLLRHGISVRIVNLAMKMILDESFDPEKFIAKLHPIAFGIDLHWLPHADGSLSLARAVKKLHPDTPVIFGGLSATYYYREILEDYPFVDFVVRGDSTEEPLRRLMEAVKAGRGYESVPNLAWRDKNGNIIVNPLSHHPFNLDNLNFDYSHLLKMTIKYFDPSGYIPFQNWLSNPVTAVFSCRGCLHNCASCGGSVAGFKNVCMREKASFRSPELVAKDMKNISRYTGAPIMLIGDLLQAGEDYAVRFLEAINQYRIRNEIAIEFFNPPPEEFIERVAGAIQNFNIEISPESHDPRVRKAFGKSYSNADLERAIGAFIRNGCRRVDLFFMVGLPYQDYKSVMDTVRYCEELLMKFGGYGRLLPMISPLAPFIDPGSSIFEDPDRFGYKIFYRTLGEHREAMLKPSWKYTLNYETEWMTRSEIVNATYESALMLNDIKQKYGVVKPSVAERIKSHIRKAQTLIKRIDSAPMIDASLAQEILELNRLYSLCDKSELEWPVTGWRLNLFNVLRMLSGISPDPAGGK